MMNPQQESYEAPAVEMVQAEDTPAVTAAGDITAIG